LPVPPLAQTAASNTSSGAGPGAVRSRPSAGESGEPPPGQAAATHRQWHPERLPQPKEAAHLEKREASVQKRKQADMAKHNGHLTKAEQKGINRQQNRISRSIARDKHNDK